MSQPQSSVNTISRIKTDDSPQPQDDENHALRIFVADADDKALLNRLKKHTRFGEPELIRLEELKGGLVIAVEICSDKRNLFECVNLDQANSSLSLRNAETLAETTLMKWDHMAIGLASIRSYFVIFFYEKPVEVFDAVTKKSVHACKSTIEDDYFKNLIIGDKHLCFINNKKKIVSLDVDDFSEIEDENHENVRVVIVDQSSENLIILKEDSKLVYKEQMIDFKEVQEDLQRMDTMILLKGSKLLVGGNTFRRELNTVGSDEIQVANRSCYFLVNPSTMNVFGPSKAFFISWEGGNFLI